MKPRRLVRGALGSIVVLLFLSRCAVIETVPTPTSIAIPTPITTATPTPDPCTGWWCTVTGTVYAETAQLGDGLGNVTATLYQTSYCSPTSGEQQTVTDSGGMFEFGDVFFHDTDRIRIQFEAEGYETVQWDSADFYCFYCSCFGSPLEIVVQAAAEP
jgi:hypothetical protein